MYMASCLTLQRTSIGVESFFSLIFSYFCFFVAALSPCQGKLVRLKYISTYPMLSISSRRLQSQKTTTKSNTVKKIWAKPSQSLERCKQPPTYVWTAFWPSLLKSEGDFRQSIHHFYSVHFKIDFRHTLKLILGKAWCTLKQILGKV